MKKLSIKHSIGEEKNTYSVTELVSHVPINVIQKVHNVLYKLELINTPSPEKIKMKPTSEQKYGVESVCDITGEALPLYYAIKKMKKTTMNTTDIKLDGEQDHINILKIANTIMSERDEIYFKTVQITNYDWLTKNNLKKSIKRLNNLNLNEQGNFEVPITLEGDDETLHKDITGRMDYQDYKDVYEFKCVQELDDSHFMQLAIYKYLSEKKNKIFNYYLYNIFTDELYKLTSNHEDLKKMIKILISNRCIPIVDTDDREFIEKCYEYNFNNQYI